MSTGREEGPIYYREIQKNAYLKRIPNEHGGSKLLPLGHKKPPLKAMWTLFCVHNGRTPFLEQYPEPESPSTLAHAPVWRACLRSARHVTASVRPRAGAEYDFLVDTEHGPVRMCAPDWESMQDWVSTLRTKLHELKIVSKGENVYCAPPAPAPPRAAARDPTSPLPPTPPIPPVRVPGIELTTPPTRATQPTQPDPTPEPEVQEPQPAPAENVDISNWEPFNEEPSTSQPKIEPKKSVAKICGQNICLDDSVLKRNAATTDSDEEFFAEIDRLHESIENLSFEQGDSYKVDFKQRVVVNEQNEESTESSQNDKPSNITVIQVSNKPPHTAIPILGPSTDIFNFDFKQNVPVTDNQTDSFINIVNTEVNVHNSLDDYGTVFTNESDYGHISLTTTVNLNDNGSPNVDLISTTENDTQNVIDNGKTDISTVTLCDGGNLVNDNGIYERLCMASTSNDNGKDEASPLPLMKLKTIDKVRKSSLPNLDTESTYEYLFPNNNSNATVTVNSEPHREVNSNVTATSDRNTSVNGVPRVANSERTDGENRVHLNLTNAVSVGNVDLNSRVIRANVERSHSQNAYDSSPRRELVRRAQNISPKRDVKHDKTETPHPKPIWKRGLTELSLLSRLRGIGQGKKQDNDRSPTRLENDNDRGVNSSVKVVHRSRPEVRVDSTRRRSSSLSNGESPSGVGVGPAGGAVGAGRGAGGLVPLRVRQAAGLRAEQRRGAAAAAHLVAHAHPPRFADYDNQVWIAWWGGHGARAGGRAGDRVAAVRGSAPRDATHASQLYNKHSHIVDILFHRVPLGKIYVLFKRDMESIGIKLDNECNITTVEPNGPAARAGIPPPGRWAVTEVNNRHINLIKGGEEEMNRLSLHGTEVSVLIQPSALVKKLRAALKANKPLLSR